MLWILCAIAVLITAMIIFFRHPYSRVKNRFEKDVRKHFEHSDIELDIPTEREITLLPEPVQKYCSVAGFLDKFKMKSMYAHMRSVPLKESNHKPPMIVDYTLYLFAHEPVRLAYIKTSMFGIPFEGYDSTQDGVGFMQGVIGKVITLFNQTGAEMDKGQLLTYLGESILLSSALLSPYITWESIDANRAKATITYKGISGSGVFTFSNDGFVESFYTAERAQIQSNGKISYPGWSVVYENYKLEKGIYRPKNIKAIWHEQDGDLVYFNESNLNLQSMWMIAPLKR